MRTQVGSHIGYTVFELTGNAKYPDAGLHRGASLLEDNGSASVQGPGALSAACDCSFPREL